MLLNGMTMLRHFCLGGMALIVAGAAAHAADTGYLKRAAEVQAEVQKTFFMPKSSLYADKVKDRKPAFMWGDGIAFSALVAAARHDPAYKPVVSKFFDAMNSYWDSKEQIPGYEPAPTNGHGHDKYYDDNEWMVITFAEAYHDTRDVKYLNRASETLKFVLSGWDDTLGGGIWWHETHKGGGKNTCSNGPAAVACLVLADELPASQASQAVAMAKKIVAWTQKNLQAKDGLYQDNINADTHKMGRFKLTYNTALMIRAELDLYRSTHDQTYLNEAKRVSKAADDFVDKKTGAFRDAFKWSHLMVEADCDLYAQTKDPALLKRAKASADHFYDVWSKQPPVELIDDAAIARTLWLVGEAAGER